MTEAEKEICKFYLEDLEKHHTCNEYKLLMQMLEQEPCDDAISRQEAIRAIEALQRPIMREASDYYQFKFSGMSEAREVVVNLPSVTPAKRVGHWIYTKAVTTGEILWSECSECKSGERGCAKRMKYCPNCGSRMGEVSE